MKVCSFLPAATRIIQELEMDDQIAGATFECPGDYPKVVRSVLENKALRSSEIDEIVGEKKKKGESLYYIDEQLLADIQPDLIFTQDVCEVCQIDTVMVQKAVKRLPKKPKIIPLLPQNLDEVLNTFHTIAQAMDEAQKGKRLLQKLRKRMLAIQQKLDKQNIDPKTLFFMEWMQPIYQAGHWIPDQIAAAGGIDRLSRPGDDSGKIKWKALQKYNPEFIVIAPCGLDIQTTVTEYQDLKALPGWEDLQAVRNKQVYAIDSDWFTCPGPDLINGIDLLAALLHPNCFSLPENSETHFQKLEK